MKKLHLLLLGLTICLFSACHDKLWDAIDGLDARVAKLEELCKEMNTNIVSIQTIVNVQQSGDYITVIVEVKKDGKVIGYTITFGKHEPITIYNGEDGSATAPIIGVAQDTDGVYYWTLNSEWLLDDNGNKLPVSGKDGQNGTNGTMPQLKIEEGYWYVSYDNGATWTQLGKATGEDGQNGDKGDKGDTGDSMFQSVTQDENYVYFTLADGTIIKIAKEDDSVLNDSTTYLGYKYVDLGLSVKWATINVGAKLPGDVGTLYTCPNSMAGGEDFAAKERGGTWRTPTVTEIQELIDSCSVELHQQINSSGEIIFGFKFIGKNKNFIFFPFLGYTQKYPEEFRADYTYYWTSNINMNDEQVTGRGLYLGAHVWFRAPGGYAGTPEFEHDYTKSIGSPNITSKYPIRPVCE
jgi:hypothetical protein